MKNEELRIKNCGAEIASFISQFFLEILHSSFLILNLKYG